MDIRDEITVNGYSIRLHPYTERRAKEIAKIQDDVDKFIAEQEKKKPGVRFRDVPRKKRAEFWMRKASILWDPSPKKDEPNESFWDEKEGFFTIDFFNSPDFEYPLLEKTETFFFGQEAYL